MRCVLTHKAEVDGTETSSEGKEGCTTFNKYKDLEAPPNSNIQVMFEREGG